MRTLVIAIAAALTLLLTAPPARASGLDPALAPFETFIGTWEVSATWSGGSEMWARSIYTPILEGRFIEVRVFVRDGAQGPIYLRYHTVIGPGDQPGAFATHNFSHDGTYQITRLDVDKQGEQAALTTQWPMGGRTIRERLDIPAPGADTAAWNVWISTPGLDDEQHIMEDAWERIAPGPEPVVRDNPIDPTLSPVDTLLGVWEVDTHWPDGRALWARSTFEQAPGGRYLHATVLARSDDEPLHNRFRSFYLASPNGGPLREITFTHVGSTMRGTLDLDLNDPDRFSVTYLTANPATPRITKSYGLTDPGTLDWIVTMRQPKNPSDRTLVEGTWHRIPSEIAMAAPIDHSLFVAAGMDTRPFTASATIDAPVQSVYAAFADADTFAKAYDPDRESLRANIDLAIGGRYEWLFDGTTGSNGCQVLSYIPDRMISFSWNAPPQQAASRAKRTWVVLEFQPDPKRPETSTNVTITHLGFGAAPHWDETRAYFQKAWPRVLEQFKANLEN